MDKYTPHPAHIVFLLFILTIVAGLAILVPHWVTAVLFIAALIIITGASLWIAWAGKIREESEYWWNIGHDIDLLRKSSPNIWNALGITDPPKDVHLEMQIVDDIKGKNYPTTKYKMYGLSPAEMQIFADGLLTGVKTLAESDWKHTVIGSTRVRKIKTQMLEDHLIGQVNSSTNTQGFLLTDYGVDYLLKYTSGYVRNTFDVSRINIIVMKPSDHPPTLEPDTFQNIP